MKVVLDKVQRKLMCVEMAKYLPSIRDQDQAQRSINAMRALLREKKTRN